MLHFLPWPILFTINSVIITLSVTINSIPVLLLSCVRLVLPFRWVNVMAERSNYVFYRIFVSVNAFAIFLTNRIDWDVQGNDFPQVKKSCIIICNHLSWADIVLLLHIYRGKIPLTKFFLKKNLIYIPLIGLACWGLGMPFLNRYTREQLIKNPELKNRDIETTRKACRRLVYAPSTLINFVEGTRYTPAKAAKSKSPYKHLMVPKSPSLAIALGEIGNDIEALFNTTMCYRYNTKSPFIDLLKGRMRTVYARIEKIPVTEELVGNYLEDKQFKHNFGVRLREIWAQKDAQLDSYLSQASPG